MAEPSSSRETCNRILLRLGLIALAVVGFMLAVMVGGLAGALVAAFTVLLVMSLLGGFAGAGSAIVRDRDG